MKIKNSLIILLINLFITSLADETNDNDYYPSIEFGYHKCQANPDSFDDQEREKNRSLSRNSIRR